MNSEVVLLGFYHSAMSALAWAARHPERVRGLAIFGGALRGWDLMSGPGTQALLSLIERDWDTFVESVTHAWLGWPGGEDGRLAAEVFRNSTSPAFARATMQAASEMDVSADAPRVRAPAIVLHRRDAQVIPLDVSKRLADALPNGRLAILPGASASLFFEATDEVVRLLTSFTVEPTAPVGSVAALDRPGPPRPAAMDCRPANGRSLASSRPGRVTDRSQPASGSRSTRSSVTSATRIARSMRAVARTRRPGRSGRASSRPTRAIDRIPSAAAHGYRGSRRVLLQSRSDHDTTDDPDDTVHRSHAREGRPDATPGDPVRTARSAARRLAVVPVVGHARPCRSSVRPRL